MIINSFAEVYSPETIIESKMRVPHFIEFMNVTIW